MTGAIFSSLDHQVDSRKVVKALKKAFIKCGGVLKENTEVIKILTKEKAVRGLELVDNEIKAEKVVIAAGAWSRNLYGLPEHSRPPVRPLKGQMVSVQMEVNTPLIEHVVWGPGNGIVPSIYLVPKGDGRLLMGATVEEMGFDKKLTVGGMLELLRLAWDVLPGIYDLPVVESWAGLRPASRDDAPILGSTKTDGLFLATGHHRNGILLAPLTANAMAENINTGTVPSSIKPFHLDRFAKSNQ